MMNKFTVYQNLISQEWKLKTRNNVIKLTIDHNLANQEEGQPNNFSWMKSKLKICKMMRKFTVYQNLANQNEGQYRNI